MKRVEVSAGDVVIKQGDPGDWFYVVDSGQFAVTQRRVLIKSSASTLTKALRSVDVLSSLSALQLQRLHDILTEVTYADGEAIISQGDTGKQFYIIVEGDVLCTRREDPVNLAEEPTELMRLRQYQYFGERALLHDAPRAATVTAVGPTKCLSVERDAFEEVLGPLQKIIDAHAKHRESQALVKRLEAEAVGLTSANVDDFGVLSVVRRGDTGDDWAIVVKRGRRAGEADRHYTMRSFGKAAAVEKQQLLLLKHERELTGQLPLSSPGVALELVSFPSHTALHSVLKSVLLTNLETVMDETMSESTVRFYIASLAQALGALHNESVAFRNVNPEYLMLDSSGACFSFFFFVIQATCSLPTSASPSASRGRPSPPAARPTTWRPRWSRARGMGWQRTTGHLACSCTRCCSASRRSRARARWTCTRTSPAIALKSSCAARPIWAGTRCACSTSCSTTTPSSASAPNVRARPSSFYHS
ncbi:hypothetical protein T492DRAFT_317802 [Pavlovales sp. CCMP2436]|nr:hypothetical protein T492DRAFT_317802 [Pavlovales sp. CCMP2436]